MELYSEYIHFHHCYIPIFFTKSQVCTNYNSCYSCDGIQGLACVAVGNSGNVTKQFAVLNSVYFVVAVFCLDMKNISEKF